MKIFGKKIDKPNNVFVVIPRESGDIVFEIQSVLDFDEFDAVCPEPTMPIATNQKTGESKPQETKSFKKKASEYSDMKMAYLVIKSLEATEGLEWETVKLNDPKTYGNYIKELEESGLVANDVAKIVDGVLEANSLDDKKYAEARSRFLASRSKKAKSA